MKDILLTEYNRRIEKVKEEYSIISEQLDKLKEFFKEDSKKLHKQREELEEIGKEYIDLEEKYLEKQKELSEKKYIISNSRDYHLCKLDELELPTEEDLKELSYKYPISISSIIELAEIAKDEVLEWVNKKRIPKKIYNELAKEKLPLPKMLYTDQKKGKAWAQIHLRGIDPEDYEKVKSGKMKLWESFLGNSVHIDLRIDYDGLEKLVQYVITENDIQSMVRMMKGEKRETAGGVMNVQHSKVVSKPSGEPPDESPEKFYKVDPESSQPSEYTPSIDEEGAKLAESLDLGESSYWIEPGGIGATKNTYSYMMHIWSGEVITGCQRHDLHELFMYKKEGKSDIYDGKFIIKCLQDNEGTSRWEIWKAISDSRPMDSIQHSDISYHYLVPSDKVDGFGREDYREDSIKLFSSKLK